MQLSLLIPTLEARKQYLDRLMSVLNPQLTNEIEVVIESDNGEQTTGAKRNKLLSKAKGEYIAFIDDDDLVSSIYCSSILKAINSTNPKPDVIGIHLHHFVDGIIHGMTFHSLEYRNWWDRREQVLNYTLYYRNPNHINPVKKEFALKAGFPDITIEEDRAYSKNILQYLNTEVYIKEPIYYYLYRSKK